MWQCPVLSSYNGPVLIMKLFSLIFCQPPLPLPSPIRIPGYALGTAVVNKCKIRSQNSKFFLNKIYGETSWCFSMYSIKYDCVHNCTLINPEQFSSLLLNNSTLCMLDEDDEDACIIMIMINIYSAKYNYNT